MRPQALATNGRFATGTKDPWQRRIGPPRSTSTCSTLDNHRSRRCAGTGGNADWPPTMTSRR
eukprot:6878106-Lingulodinium_polyedra.AAC.1